MSDLDPVLSAEDTEILAAAVPPVTPLPALRARLLSQLERYCATGPAVDIRHNEGEWTPIGVPGIDRRVLYRDPQTGYATFYLRMAPGSVLPAHRHTTNEQCLMLEGHIQWDDLRFGPGDFVVAAADTVHSPIRTEEGALVLIISR